LNTRADDNSLSNADRHPRPLRILIVGDERDTVMTLGILLRSEGIDVRLASGGVLVQDEVAEFGPDAVLLDLAMPDRNGFAAAQKLSQRYGHRCPTLVAVTARTTGVVKQKAAASGFRHLVAKPYDPNALLKLVFSLPRLSA